MPIVSRRLHYYRPQVDGSANYGIVFVDHLGRSHPARGNTTATEQQVINQMNNADLTDMLQRDEKKRGYALAVAVGNVRAPDTIDTVGAANSDVTQQQMDRHIIKAAQIDDHPGMLGPLATDIKTYTANQISNALWGDTSASHVQKANKILAYADLILSDIIPAADACAAHQEEMLADDEMKP